MADEQKVKKTGLVGWLWRVFLFFGSLFVAVHVYALVLFFAPVPGTANMALKALEGTPVQRTWVSLDNISPHLVRAVIAAEDTRFCAHPGVDMEAIQDAIDERERTGRVRGGSTLTQQTAKNVFLWNGGGMARKGVEAWFSVFIDGFWGKRRIMEVYLNVAEWGDGIYGAEAAAQLRFGKPARDLTPYQAALLASVLPSPNKWRVDPPGPYVRKRSGTLLARMGVVERDGLDACVLN